MVQAGGKDYPWRRTEDPWHILVSELMLQQTTIPRCSAGMNSGCAASPLRTTWPPWTNRRPCVPGRVWGITAACAPPGHRARNRHFVRRNIPLGQGRAEKASRHRPVHVRSPALLRLQQAGPHRGRQRGARAVPHRQLFHGRGLHGGTEIPVGTGGRTGGPGSCAGIQLRHHGTGADLLPDQRAGLPALPRALLLYGGTARLYQ